MRQERWSRMKTPDAKEGRVPANSGRDGRRTRFPARLLGIVFLILATGTGTAWWAVSRVAKAEGQSSTSSVARNTGNLTTTADSLVFTPAHQTVLDAVKEFFFYQSTPVQPIAFNHSLHLQHGMQCTSCHAGVTQGPDAGIPSASFCMACHQVIAADKPEIKKLGAYADKGQDIPWQRVYWFYPTAHVQFWHAPHINAGVSCGQCHGDMSQQTVALKKTNLTMNFCLSCHKAKGVSVDCTTCHY